MLKTYEIHFSGRTNNSIGRTYQIVETVKAESKQAAILKLYEKYEHIFYVDSDIYELGVDLTPCEQFANLERCMKLL